MSVKTRRISERLSSIVIASSASPAWRTSKPASSIIATALIRNRNSSSTISTMGRLATISILTLLLAGGPSAGPLYRSLAVQYLFESSNRYSAGGLSFLHDGQWDVHLTTQSFRFKFQARLPLQLSG